MAGIVPRVGIRLLAENSHATELRFSMLEIYQEKLRDLFASTIDSKSLRIREKNGCCTIEGLTELEFKTDAEFMKLLNAGLKKRVVGDHLMNAESSRSHLCCVLNIRQLREGRRIKSKIHLIDLAGSEMVRKTDASGTRLQEAKHINKSLSALGNVIFALTTPQPTSATGSAVSMTKTEALTKKVHIPYRDSKLTRILQDSLGGNSRIVLM